MVAAIDAVIKIRPSPRATMAGSRRFAIWTTDSTFKSISAKIALQVGLQERATDRPASIQRENVDRPATPAGRRRGSFGAVIRRQVCLEGADCCASGP
jgi:hypothetical protein